MTIKAKKKFAVFTVNVVHDVMPQGNETFSVVIDSPQTMARLGRLVATSATS